MDNKKENSPFSILWKWAESYHGELLLAVLLAILGVACNMIPYCHDDGLAVKRNGYIFLPFVVWDCFSWLCRKVHFFYIINLCVPYSYFSYIERY